MKVFKKIEKANKDLKKANEEIHETITYNSASLQIWITSACKPTIKES